MALAARVCCFLIFFGLVLTKRIEPVGEFNQIYNGLDDLTPSTTPPARTTSGPQHETRSQPTSPRPTTDRQPTSSRPGPTSPKPPTSHHTRFPPTSPRPTTNKHTTRFPPTTRRPTTSHGHTTHRRTTKLPSTTVEPNEHETIHFVYDHKTHALGVFETGTRSCYIVKLTPLEQEHIHTPTGLRSIELKFLSMLHVAAKNTLTSSELRKISGTVGRFCNGKHPTHYYQFTL
ncbi:hypothetical protein ScPMuIL_013130 [Solemya velum]